MIKEYGYEYDATLDIELWEKSNGKVTYDKLWDAICLRSGRDALKTIAREYTATTVFMPALACESMILPFEMYGHTNKYYKLRPDYTIDLEYLEQLLQKNGKSGLFLYMDYFGLSSISDRNLDSLRNKYPKLVFIEDRTHNLIWKKTRLFEPDYIMASLRKWLNVPDGGLLWPKANLTQTDFGEDTSFSSARLKAQCMRAEFFETGNPETKIAYRKIFSTVSDILDKDMVPSRMSLYSYQLACGANWNDIRRLRKKNAETLIGVLKESNAEIIQPQSELSDLYVPFKISNREHKQKKLSSMGIYNTIIWPLNEKQKHTCSVARDTEERMLAAPCDQRYTIEDMMYIASEIVRVVNE